MVKMCPAIKNLGLQMSGYKEDLKTWHFSIQMVKTVSLDTKWSGFQTQFENQMFLDVILVFAIQIPVTLVK